jgi:hypothetical protein
MSNQARQREPATDFQYALPGLHAPPRQPGRQMGTRWPEQPKQRPRGRRNPKTLGHTEWIGKLLAIEQATNV